MNHSNIFWFRGNRQRDLKAPLLLCFALLLLSVTVNAEQLDWVKQIASTGGDYGNAIVADNAGNIFVTGSITTATFASGEPDEITLPTVGSGDIFLAKYKPDGGLVWAKRAGGEADDRGTAVAVDSDGNSYITGYFRSSSITFGEGDPHETTLAEGSFGQIFIAKYDRAGHLLWVRSAGGQSSDAGTGIALDQHNNVYVTGYFRDTATFGKVKGRETILYTEWEFDGSQIFIAKYTPRGQLIWALSAGGRASDQANAICLDDFGNILVTGYVSGDSTFGKGQANETTLPALGFSDPDIFVAKYSGAGELLWAKNAGANSFDEAYGIAVDDHGDAYVTGDYGEEAMFGPGETGQVVLGSRFGDIFLAKFAAADGDLLWVRSAVGPSGDNGRSLALDKAGNVYLAGSFYRTLVFADGEINRTELTASLSFGTNLFVARYTTAGEFRWAWNAGATPGDGEGSGNTTAYGINTDALGNILLTGQFGGTTHFTLGENLVTLTADTFQPGRIPGSDIFIARLSPDNHLPRVVDDVYTIRSIRHLPLSVASPGVLGNDDDPDGELLSAMLVSATEHGELLFESDGSFIYTPDKGFIGEDRFTYVASDGISDSIPATVLIHVKKNPKKHSLPQIACRAQRHSPCR